MNDDESIVLDEPVPVDGESVEDTGATSDSQGGTSGEVAPIAVTDGGALARLDAISGQIDKLIGTVDSLEKTVDKQQEQTRDVKESAASTVVVDESQWDKVESAWQFGKQGLSVGVFLLACLLVAVGIKIGEGIVRHFVDGWRH